MIPNGLYLFLIGFLSLHFCVYHYELIIIGGFVVDDHKL